MSLTMGTAPFGHAPAGSFSHDVPDAGGLLYIEDSPRRVRGYLDGELVVDSRRVKLLHEHGLLPVWYFPREDVRAELLEDSDHGTHCPKKGDASYHSVRVGDRVAENAIWHYPEPVEGAEAIAGHVAFYFDALDRWLEEDEEVFVHPRDPYHRVDVLATSRHVRVTLGDEILAESERTRVVFETGLPPRYYFPREDVSAELQSNDGVVTRCPYKGIASYHDAGAAPAIAWEYLEPIPAVADLAGLVCFFGERAEIEVDGEPQEMPPTPWSGTDWIEHARTRA
jgi:uncharacterized protein (DUF427 family)